MDLENNETISFRIERGRVMLLFKATLMIYNNKRMNWPSDWRILRPNDTKQRNPAPEKSFVCRPGIEKF